MKTRTFVAIQTAFVAMFMASVASATPPKPTTSLLDPYGNFNVVAANTSGTQSGWVYMRAGSQSGTSDFNLMPPARLHGGDVLNSSRDAGDWRISGGYNVTTPGKWGDVILGTDPGIGVSPWGPTTSLSPGRSTTCRRSTPRPSCLFVAIRPTGTK